MECYKGALKSSLVGELAFQAISIPSDEIKEEEDFLGLNGVEDFSSIDCFFDFGEFNEGCFEKTLKEQKHDDDDGTNVDDDSNSNFSSSSNSFLDTELCASLSQVHHVEDIEWLSKFVEDSSSEHHPVFYTFEPEPRPASVQPSCVLPFHVPTKRRTKRPRQIGRNWFGSNSTDYSSSSSSSSFSSSSPCLIYANVQTMDILNGWNEPAAKKPKKRSQTSANSTQFQRRCSHCQVNKTPQWRTGPLGAKTLCNACGVRYKSGRLFPEYRPACSPTFSSDVHSNSHRKVLEIRKTRESWTVEPNF